MNGFLVSSSPHIKDKASTDLIMLDVILALTPAIICGVWFFGLRAAIIIAVCVISSVLSEWIWQKSIGKKTTIGDLSAVVTGIILALNLPPTLPYWIAVVGSAFAIIIVKQFFGGIGRNFANPAATARAFLLAAYLPYMTKFVMPFESLSIFGTVDAVTSATPLAIMKSGNLENMPSLFNTFIGNIGGSLGETSALFLMLGGIYLIIRKVIDWQTPVFYILTVAVFTYIATGFQTQMMLYHLFTGGLMIAAFFMLTDYVCSPLTIGGKIIFAVLCGLLTSVIRLYGGYPEGASYAIVLSNICVPVIDKVTKPRIYGAVR